MIGCMKSGLVPEWMRLVRFMEISCETILRGDEYLKYRVESLAFMLRPILFREDQNSLIVPQVGHCVRYQFNADPSWTLLQTNGGVVFFVFC